jgi:type I restriction enzyme R subunit
MPTGRANARPKEQIKADIEVFILDEVFASLPTPPFSVQEKEQVAKNVYAHVWQQAARGDFSAASTL